MHLHLELTVSVRLQHATHDHTTAQWDAAGKAAETSVKAITPCGLQSKHARTYVLLRYVIEAEARTLPT